MDAVARREDLVEAAKDTLADKSDWSEARRVELAVMAEALRDYQQFGYARRLVRRLREFESTVDLCQLQAICSYKAIHEDFDIALSVARGAELILDRRQALDLTILAARSRKPMYDPMAVRWIKVVDDKGRLKLDELTWLGHAFGNLWRGDQASAKQLERFLDWGRR